MEWVGLLNEKKKKKNEIIANVKLQELNCNKM